MGNEVADKENRILIIILFGGIFLSISNMIIAFFGFPINFITVAVQLALYILFVKGYLWEKGLRPYYPSIFIMAAATLLYSYLMKYFKVVGWDGAIYLLNANMFNTGNAILSSYYRPLTWSSFLSMGLAFNLKEIIPIIAGLMLVIATYLFSYYLIKKHSIALGAAAVSALLPVQLLWGISYYADSFAVVCMTGGFAAYFMYDDSKRKTYYMVSMIFFLTAFLTKYTYGALLIIPLVDALRKRFVFQSLIPVSAVMAAYLLYIASKTGSLLYSFIFYFKTASSDYGHNVFSNSYYLKEMPTLFSWPVFILGLIGLAVLLLKHRNNKTLSIMLVSIPLTIYNLIFHLKDIRYFMFLIPVISVCSVIALSHIPFAWKTKAGKIISTSTLVGMLIANSAIFVMPEYKFTGRDVVEEAAKYLKGTQGNIVSNSHVRMSWYMQKKVFNAVELDQLADYISKNNITYMVNFEHSGTPVSFKNTTRLLEYGSIEKTYSDGYETINIIKVQER